MDYNEQPTIDVDKAWDTLYSRLQEDQQLGFRTKKRHFFTSPTFRWIAAATIALCVTTAAIHYWIPDHKTPLLSMRNADRQNVLVKTLNDGSTVYLASNSSFFYPEKFADNARNVRMQGDAFFDIAKNPDKPFRIETSKIIVEVLGTAFNVKSNENAEFQLTVLRGKVKVTQKKNGESAYVVAGEGIKIVDSHWVRYQNQDPSLFDYYSKNMRFKDEPLDRIVKVINQYSTHKIALKGEGIQSRKLNVKFYNNDINGITNVISLALHLKREITPDSVYVLRP